LRKELDECRAALNELRAASLARQRAEVEFAGLYREPAIARARAVERDPRQPLNYARTHKPRSLPSISDGRSKRWRIPIVALLDADFVRTRASCMRIAR
jgi:hypothetical protein